VIVLGVAIERPSTPGGIDAADAGPVEAKAVARLASVSIEVGTPEPGAAAFGLVAMIGAGAGSKAGVLAAGTEMPPPMESGATTVVVAVAIVAGSAIGAIAATVSGGR